MSSVETGQTSAVETGQMSAAETAQMSAVETRQILLVEDEIFGFPKPILPATLGGILPSDSKRRVQNGRLRMKTV